MLRPLPNEALPAADPTATIAALPADIRPLPSVDAYDEHRDAIIDRLADARSATAH